MEEHLIALEVDLSVLEQGLIAGHLSLCLGQLHLEGTRVDFGQQIAVANNVAFLEGDLHQLAVNAALNCHSVERRHGTQAVEING